MPVIVNDFEIIVDGEQPQAQSAGRIAEAGPGEQPVRPLKPEDVAEIEFHVWQRAMRVRAH